ncbi:short-chain fatty acid transporter [Cupriavidus plantarum]|uniref:short-chain fatty acid transporter n=1 Tax=Cupriavidus plantarum TaxID=942865 RepID=UPI001B26189C|nr:short-chain fatty acid transporter [Cupriavidus plantarum]CAG2147317.1 hypothetical protein LMG26296_04076 [Cupriavidus plantarum]SMR85593.1 hypothetical protein SAMN05421735_4400 [Cupriavidus plantarum]
MSRTPRTPIRLAPALKSTLRSTLRSTPRSTLQSALTPTLKLASALTLSMLAACTSTPFFDAPSQPQRLPSPAPAPSTTITPAPGSSGAYGGLSRATLEAAGNACEKVVANAVKTRYPQPGSIMMMPDRERIYQQSATQAGVNGEGTFEPDASDEAMSFRYTCLFNIRTNRVDDVQMRY